MAPGGGTPARGGPPWAPVETYITPRAGTPQCGDPVLHELATRMEEVCDRAGLAWQAVAHYAWPVSPGKVAQLLFSGEEAVAADLGLQFRIGHVDAAMGHVPGWRLEVLGPAGLHCAYQLPDMDADTDKDMLKARAALFCLQVRMALAAAPPGTRLVDVAPELTDVEVQP